MKTLSLIGAGKLGQTLAHLWHTRGQFRIQQVLTRSLPSARAACDFIGGGEAIDEMQDLLPADLWLIATPDGDIARCAERLQPLLSPNTILFHCSGALNSDILNGTSGAAVASIHPIHSFASPAESVGKFAGSFCGYEGSDTALAVLKPAFESLGAQLFAIDGQHKTLYHAASVIACNYLVSLMDASLTCFEAAGVSRTQAQQLLLPITHQTLDNALHGTPGSALTGPISRGDLHTVERQLAQLQHLKPELARLYAVLGMQTVELAQARPNPASPAQLAAIESLLTNAAKPV